MASWLTKLVDRITPWDRGGEVQRRQEEEERRRRAARAAQSAPKSTSSPTIQPSFNTPLQNTFDTNTSLSEMTSINDAVRPKPASPQLKKAQQYLPKAPEQSFWDKARDIFDANTEADQHRRATAELVDNPQLLKARGSETKDQAAKRAATQAQILSKAPHRSAVDDVREFGKIFVVDNVVDAAKSVGRGARNAAVVPIESARAEIANLTGNKAAERAANRRIDENLFGKETLEDGELGYSDLFSALGDSISILPAAAALNKGGTALKAATAQGGTAGARTAIRGVIRAADEALLGLGDVRSITRGAAATDNVVNQTDDIISKAPPKNAGKVEIASGVEVDAPTPPTRPQPDVPTQVIDDLPPVRPDLPVTPLDPPVVRPPQAPPAFGQIVQPEPLVKAPVQQSIIPDVPEQIVDVPPTQPLRQAADDVTQNIIEQPRVEPELPATKAPAPRARAEAQAAATPDIVPVDNSGRPLAQADEVTEVLPEQSPIAPREGAEVTVDTQATAPKPKPATTKPLENRVAQALDPQNKSVTYRNLSGEERKIYKQTQADNRVRKTTDASAATPQNLKNLTSETKEATVAAPGQRSRAARATSDQELKQMFKKDPQLKNNASVEELRDASFKNVESKNADELVRDYGKPLDQRPDGVIGNAQEYYEHIHAIKRLEGVGTDAAREAATNALDALTEFASRQGYNLRATRVLYDEMPATMKVNYMKKVADNMGSTVSPANEKRLFDIAEKQGSLSGKVEDLDKRYTQAFEKMRNKEQLSDNELLKLVEDYDEVMDELGGLNREAVDIIQGGVGKSSLAARHEQNMRLSMLSSVSGRLFDNVSTGVNIMTYMADTLNQSLINKLFRRGANSSGISISQLTKGGWKGLKDLKAQYYGKGSAVENFDSYLKRMTHGRAENTASVLKYGRIGESRPAKFLRNTIHAGVDLPTALTKGVSDVELARVAKLEAGKLNLSKKQTKAFTEAFKRFAPEDVKRSADQAHLAINNLHSNPVTREMGNVWLKAEKAAADIPVGPARSAAQLAVKQLKLITMPFQSFFGGSVHKALTSRNVLYNMYEITKGISTKNADTIAKATAELGTNVGVATGVGYMMAKNGMIVEQDENGDSYDGMYFKLGDTYIPIGIANHATMPIIMGASLGLSDGDPVKAATNSWDTALKTLGVSSMLGGTSTASLITSAESETSAPKVAGTAIRQYIPSITGDINSVLNRMDSFNPTRETADTSATRLNPKTGRQVTDQIQKQKNLTKNRIPFLSQSLPRKPDTNAQNFVERIFKAGSKSPSMRAKEAKAEAELERGRETLNKVINNDKLTRFLEDNEMAKWSLNTAKEKGLDKLSKKNIESIVNGVTDNKVVRKLQEEGEWGSYITVNELNLEKLKANPKTSTLDIEKAQTKVTQGEVFKELKADPDLVRAYFNKQKDPKGITVTEWRKLEETNPELYQAIWNLDGALAKRGASDAKNPKERKFNIKEGRSGRGSGRGGGASSRSSSASQIASVLTGSTKENKYIAIDKPKSYIPDLNTDNKAKTNLKKSIKVQKGVKYT